MTPTVRLALGAGIVVGVTTYMAYVGASASWRYYVTADECVARLSELSGSRVRVSGQVAAGTLQMTPARSRVSFVLQGMESRLPVTGSGPFPDNLDEGVEVVVEGTLDPTGVLRADKVLTKCASKYEEQRAERDEQSSSRKGGGAAPDRMSVLLDPTSRLTPLTSLGPSSPVDPLDPLDREFFVGAWQRVAKVAGCMAAEPPAQCAAGRSPGTRRARP